MVGRGAGPVERLAASELGGYLKRLYPAERFTTADQLPPAGNCIGRPCWRALANGDGFRYRDPGRLPSGLDQLTLRAGTLGRSTVSVRGRGVSLPDPPMPFQQSPHVTVQVVNSLGNCWGVDYVTPARTNTGTHLLLKEKP